MHRDAGYHRTFVAHEGPNWYSQYIALVMVAIQLSEDRISFNARRSAIIDGLHELPGQIKQILAHDSEFQALANTTLGKERSLLIIGRGYQHATCLEAALKIKVRVVVARVGVVDRCSVCRNLRTCTLRGSWRAN